MRVRVLSLCVYMLHIYYAHDHVQVAMHHTITQLRINAVIVATTISATALWVLWCQTDSVYTEFCYTLPMTLLKRCEAAFNYLKYKLFKNKNMILQQVDELFQMFVDF